MERITRDTYRLASGREFRANCGIIGLVLGRGAIFSDPDSWEVSNGYDSHIYGAFECSDVDDDNWTPAERRELAEYMIALWAKFRDEQAA